MKSLKRFFKFLEEFWVSIVVGMFVLAIIFSNFEI